MPCMSWQLPDAFSYVMSTHARKHTQTLPRNPLASLLADHSELSAHLFVSRRTCLGFHCVKRSRLCRRRSAAPLMTGLIAEARPCACCAVLRGYGGRRACALYTSMLKHILSHGLTHACRVCTCIHVPVELGG